MGRAFRYRYSWYRRSRLHQRSCIGDAASMDAYAFSRLHRRYCIGDTASAIMHRRHCIFEAPSAILHLRHCIGKATSAKLHRRSCINGRLCMFTAMSATLLGRCMGEAALAMLHRWTLMHIPGCIDDAAWATLHTCYAMYGDGDGQWAMNATTYLMHMRCCVGDAVLLHWKKILWKQNFFAIPNIVQNSGKLFFSLICRLE